MPSVIVTKRDLWPPNMVKSMQLLDAVLRQDRTTVMDPRGGLSPPVLIYMRRSAQGDSASLPVEHPGHGRHRSSLQPPSSARWRWT